MNKRDLITLCGFLLFALGITSIILNIIGADWYILGFFNYMPSLLAFLIRLLMMVVGIMMMVTSKMR